MPAFDHITLDELDTAHHRVLAEMRAVSPVLWLSAVDGWVVTGRDVAVAVMRDAVTFTVDDPRFSTAQVIGPSMLSLDGTEHARHRDPFVAAFRPAEMSRRYADSVPSLARELVAGLVPFGSAELRRQLAGPLAVGVVAQSLGIDDLEPGQLLGWYDAIVEAVGVVSTGAPVPDSGHEAFAHLAAALRSASRRDDSVLHDVTATLSDAEVVSNAAVFLFGGIETSEGMTTSLLWHLLAHPDQLAMVRADRQLADAAVEESLRLEPAAARVDRYATRDVELASAHIRRGDLVVVSLSGANRDPAVYDRPDHLDITRANARTHLAFAQGPHACIGAQLARIEARAALDAVLDLLPGVELAEAAEAGGVIFRKPPTLHARWPVASD
ncbi:MAG: cytochrome P450 [Ilumatobacteraceae bacterium]